MLSTLPCLATPNTWRGWWYGHPAFHVASGVLSPSTSWALDDLQVAAGLVNPVKDQGSCGACWAFAATAAIETASAIRDGNLTSLSEEQLLDCGSSTSPNGNGCNGGNAQQAFSYVIGNGGIADAASYPYDGKTSMCAAMASTYKPVQIEGYRWIMPQSESALMAAVARSPVVVAMAAGSSQVRS
jgi:C1A family cysteine protease